MPRTSSTVQGKSPGKSRKRWGKSDPPKPLFKVWKAIEAADNVSSSGVEIGAMVTDANNPNRLIAYIPAPCCETRITEEAIRLAIALIENPGDILNTARCVDLRSFCKPDSASPLPEWAFHIALAPLDASGKEIEDGRVVYPVPPCRFRIARMILELYPWMCTASIDKEPADSIYVGVCTEEDGQQCYCKNERLAGRSEANAGESPRIGLVIRAGKAVLA